MKGEREREREGERGREREEKKRGKENRVYVLIERKGKQFCERL